MIPSWKSLLFVAADDQARLAKVAERGAGAVILDLEDAVPPDRKSSALAGLPGVLSTLASRDCPVVVRINAEWRLAMVELAIVVRPDVAAIMIPKVENVPRLTVLSEMIAELAADAGMATPPGIIALVESPRGLAVVDEIAKVGGVAGLAFGTEDFSLALGVPPTAAALDLPCRLIALAAASHGIMALGLPVSIATIADSEAWAQGVRAARAVGMTGAICIHPGQVGPANDGFAPSEMEAAMARRVIEIWDAAGGAGVIQLDGKMIDRPVMLAARRVIGRTAEKKELTR
jgi:citrate lyase subunit beta/citryl-CoA lyase